MCTKFFEYSKKCIYQSDFNLINEVNFLSPPINSKNIIEKLGFKGILLEEERNFCSEIIKYRKVSYLNISINKSNSVEVLEAK